MQDMVLIGGTPKEVNSRLQIQGYLVRIAPNEVACSDPEAIKVYTLSLLERRSHFFNITEPDHLRLEGGFQQSYSTLMSPRRRSPTLDRLL